MKQISIFLITIVSFIISCLPVYAGTEEQTSPTGREAEHSWLYEDSMAQDWLAEPSADLSDASDDQKDSANKNEKNKSESDLLLGWLDSGAESSAPSQQSRDDLPDSLDDGWKSIEKDSSFSSTEHENADMSVQAGNPWEKNILKEEHGIIGKVKANMQGTTPKEKVFGVASWNRDQIKGVYVLDTLRNMPPDAVDLSAGQDGSVMGWVDSSKELFIAGEGGVRAPDNSNALFAWFENAEVIDLGGNLHTDHTSKMGYLFGHCPKLKTLNLKGLRTDKIKKYTKMFAGCRSLESLDLSGFNTENATGFFGLFWSCEKLEELDLSSFRSSYVEDFQLMFRGCASLKRIIWNPEYFSTASATEMGQMFCDCSSLSDLDVSCFDTGNVINMYMMFGNCSSLERLDVSGWNLSRVDTHGDMFANADKLIERFGQNGEVLLSAGQGGADKDSFEFVPDQKENYSSAELFLEGVPESFYYASGAGGWSTNLNLKHDGTFTGRFQDSNMGQDNDLYAGGTCYICDFYGRFSDFQRVDDYTVRMRLSELDYIYEVGDNWVDSGVHFIASEAYGLSGGEWFTLYMNGHETGSLPDSFKGLARFYMNLYNSEFPPCLTIYGIYNETTEAAFGSEDRTEPNNQRNQTASDFLIPDSNVRLLSESDIRGFSSEQVQTVINEIYARHGYKFHMPEWYDYFRKFSWYNGINGDMQTVYDSMNGTERANVEFLSRYL